MQGDKRIDVARMLKLSVVTISYNQIEFLERCIKSVLDQQYENLEYIIVDPGSTDGSREMILKYANVVNSIIFEPDNGPADGLNNGFAKATGDVLYYINSDDKVLPDAFARAMRIFDEDSGLDVLLGNGLKIDKGDSTIRKIRIDKFDPKHFVYGATIMFQQGCFFKRTVFESVGGFNANNRVSWDAELLIDLALAKRNFKKCNLYLGAIRAYGGTITEQIESNPQFRKKYQENKERLFLKVMKRPKGETDKYIRYYYYFLKFLYNPHNFLKIFRYNGRHFTQ
jgi:glycosyltransferase involved in cell wall biosynthesis